MRVDGPTMPGSELRLVDDLDLPDHAALTMLGGGAIGLSFSQALMDDVDVSFVAEYWTHQWSGHETLRSAESFHDRLFPIGSSVESRLTLSVLTLDVTGTLRDGPYRGGMTLSLQGTSARLRMDSPSVSAKETIEDAGWGGGLFFEVSPTRHLFAGVSAKGFTSFHNAWESGTGDFRGYAGVEWGLLRLEAGYRVWIHDLDVPEKALNYILYGPYAALSLSLEF